MIKKCMALLYLIKFYLLPPAVHAAQDDYYQQTESTGGAVHYDVTHQPAEIRSDVIADRGSTETVLGSAPVITDVFAGEGVQL